MRTSAFCSRIRWGVGEVELSFEEFGATGQPKYLKSLESAHDLDEKFSVAGRTDIGGCTGVECGLGILIGCPHI
jgi:hypothetical protein